MKRIFLLLIFAALTIIALPAQAVNYQDVVYLKNGSVVHGIIIEQYPDVSLKIETTDGNVFVFNISDVEKIAKEKVSENVSPAATEVSSAGVSSGGLPVYRYMFGNRINPVGGRKSPALAGWMSFLIPGVGQWINGDIGAGWFFFTASTACTIWFLSSLRVEEYYSGGYNSGVTIKGNLLPLMLDLGICIWAAGDGASRARKVNFARGFALNNSMYLNVKPTIMRNDILQQGISLNPSNYSYGLKMNLSF